MNKKLLKLEKPKSEKVKITNFMVDIFQREASFKKLRQAIGLRAADKYKIFRLTEVLTNGPEARALNAAKDEMIKTNKDEKLSYTHPKVVELMELESGLEIEKLTLKVSRLPADFTPEDMMITSWLVDYTDDVEKDGNS